MSTTLKLRGGEESQGQADSKIATSSWTTTLENLSGRMQETNEKS
jgi:hypothetical protein